MNGTRGRWRINYDLKSCYSKQEIVFPLSLLYKILAVSRWEHLGEDCMNDPNGEGRWVRQWWIVQAALLYDFRFLIALPQNPGRVIATSSTWAGTGFIPWTLCLRPIPYYAISFLLWGFFDAAVWICLRMCLALILAHTWKVTPVGPPSSIKDGCWWVNAFLFQLLGITGLKCIL